MNRTLRACVLLCLGIILVSCTYPGTMAPASPPTLNLVTVAPNASATSTPFQPVGATFTPTASATLSPSATLPPSATPVPTDTPVPTGTPTAAPVTNLPPPTSARTQYTFYVLFDYAGKQLAVDESIRYTNQTGGYLSEIVLAVEANRYANSFLLETLFVDGSSVNYNLNGHSMSVYLPVPLAPGGSINLSMRYTLAIPPKQRAYPHGYLSYQVNLTDWYPFIVPYRGGWVLHDPWSFGEHLVYEAADFDVNIKTLDAGIVIAASALPEPNGEWTRYRLPGGRTFVFSASDRYQVAETVVRSVTVRSYYFPWHERAGQGIFDAAWKSVATFESKFGAYPYSSLSVVETDVPDGQEFDGLVFLSSKFYDEYAGFAKSNLVSIGVHEIAHQWWFGLVGNDQALEPWLDEALATYSERVFYENHYPELGNWWWDFRVNYFSPSGWVDTTVYNGGSFRAYTNAVYLNGAYFLKDVRLRTGDQAFFDFLKDYTTRFARGHATAYDFFAVLRQNTGVDFTDLLQAYFQGSY